MGKGKTQKTIGTLVWSMDLFQDSKSLKSHVKSMLREWTRLGTKKVIPVYILSPNELGMGLELSKPWFDLHAPNIFKAMKQELSEIHLPEFTEPEVILVKKDSTRERVKTLLQFSARVRADMILVGTHAKEGMQRFFLGSFTESLIQASKIPVCVVNPHSKVFDHISPFVFPTDFSAHSLKLYRKVLELSKHLKNEILLVNIIPTPADPVVQSGAYISGAGWISVTEYLKSEKMRRELEMERWVKLASKHKVKARAFVLEEEEDIEETILHVAKREGAGLLTVFTHSGALASALLGSVSRNLLRHSEIPVLVWKI